MARVRGDQGNAPPRARGAEAQGERAAGEGDHGRAARPSHRLPLHGVVVIDKPTGPTSHDVVARVRRMLGEKRVGHAGTLDPMASGVLVVLVGEATKLAPYLTAHDKRYETVVALGAATDTLDAEGTVTAEAPVPEALRGAIERALLRATPTEASAAGIEPDAEDAPLLAEALAAERARTEQTPPAYSAIKVGGQRSYDRARAGEAIDLAPRPVVVRALSLRGGARGLESTRESASASSGRVLLPLELEVSKGYYVRSLARDLGERLGVPAHLTALRRTKSGPFTIADAAPLDAGPDAIQSALCPLAVAAARALGAARLTEAGAARARHGKQLSPADFAEAPPPGSDPTAWLDPSGGLVAVGQSTPSGLVILRGFATTWGEGSEP